MIDRDELYQRIRNASSMTFARSGGPGGQNVNKVNTRVTLRVPIESLGLTAGEVERVSRRLAGRLSASRELVLHSGATRSQYRNREEVLERAVEIVDSARRASRSRRPTRPPAGATERRLRRKRQRSEQKRYRRPPSRDE